MYYIRAYIIIDGKEEPYGYLADTEGAWAQFTDILSQARKFFSVVSAEAEKYKIEKYLHKNVILKIEKE